jgi:Protein of unknown function (DUF1501)
MGHPQLEGACCSGRTRRTFLADCGMGFTGLALGALLHQDGIVRAGALTSHDGKPHFAPKAKSVIWLFMIGGASHLETFDPKPALNVHAGKTVSETPYREALKSPYLKTNSKGDPLDRDSKLFPLQVGFARRGKCGIELSDWWPNLSECIDDLAVVRSMWTTDNNHGGQLQFHTGRLFIEGSFPTIGAWVHYGLGSLNQNLPQFVVLGAGPADCCGGRGTYGATYLGPENAAVPLAVDPERPLPFASPGANAFREEQEREFGLIHRLNRAASVEYPDDPAMRARIQSYELAFRMQTSVPEVVRFDSESQATHRLYGLDRDETRSFGQICLTARRLVERGVRFVQIHHGYNGDAGQWDAHNEIRAGHGRACAHVDRPIAALIKDLKQRGLLDETLVVWGTEFGRTPMSERTVGHLNGRNHHPYGFSIWMAGGGIKGGVVHRATDEIGFHAVEDRHYVTDIHATVLHQLGLDPRRLEVPGHKRLDIDFGEPIRAIIA